jgi:alkylhydroperoxidase/carboxymuconolactone decarboxylase family protein YurZ
MEINKLVNILAASNKDIDNQKLMAYLSNTLNRDEVHELEKLMADSGLINDAIEGLQKIKQEDAELFTEKLNADLKKQLAKKRSRRNKRHFKDKAWIYVAAVLILLIILVTYIMMKIHLSST